MLVVKVLSGIVYDPASKVVKSLFRVFIEIAAIPVDYPGFLILFTLKLKFVLLAIVVEAKDVIVIIPVVSTAEHE